ncbi:twin-arginine translocase subunit TatC [Gammaproteobacteria bacterium]|nr:twin-arginine translocase subunit TatC [SAR86 cluster bacterium]MDB3880965.1 twin-arginine translocase subunit TatC [Gammaproteobacteria bacterium]MDC0577047.1 twin-arginine translocase subunit TatC [Gammaproteobacteria bacterium]MDC0590833.1 twin-arginine translocase subunit TatC [Gammaproteobacteria bacterium]MDC3322995.1 twin-arginine translocase subunit TatC [Gammaproteobacteria bacterium]
MEKNTFLEHLQELRSRLLKSLLVMMACFLGLVYFSNDIYLIISEPLLNFLPSGSSMIATEVASPFLAPLKLTFFASLLLSMPFLLNQIWRFMAPGMYVNEKKLSFLVLLSSLFLFYLGILFTYFLVLPLVFNFFTGSAPEGILIMTDISRYLDFVLSMMFAFSFAFEIPVFIFLLIWSGTTDSDTLRSKRPYVVIGCFAVGMLLTPPDVISQTLLAIPAWLLFELGIVMADLVVKKEKKDL